VHVKVMHLLRQFGRSDRTGIEVQSDKSEGTLVRATVCPDKPPLTESHVRLVAQSDSFSSNGVRSRTTTAYVG
jgi:hypothetical protein